MSEQLSCIWIVDIKDADVRRVGLLLALDSKSRHTTKAQLKHRVPLEVDLMSSPNLNPIWWNPRTLE